MTYSTTAHSASSADEIWADLNVIHLVHLMQVEARRQGFSFKVWALVYVTSFRHVVLLDADNTPLVPPQILFNLPEVAAHGNLHWPDFTRGGEGGPWWVVGAVGNGCVLVLCSWLVTRAGSAHVACLCS